MKITNTSTVTGLVFIFAATSNLFAHTTRPTPVKHTQNMFYNAVPEYFLSTKNNNVHQFTALRTAPPSRVWLDLKSANGAASQTVIAYMTQGTLGIDFGYDATRYLEDNVISVFTLQDGDAFTIQARPPFDMTDTVQLGYQAPEEGTYSISINHSDGVFAQGQIVYLQDNVTGTIANLNEGTYTFSTANGTFNERFTVGYSTEVLAIAAPATSETFNVYKSGGNINILSGAGTIQSVAIYDTMGRLLYNNSGVNSNSLEISSITSQHQVVIIESKTTSGIIRKKIIY